MCRARHKKKGSCASGAPHKKKGSCAPHKKMDHVCRAPHKKTDHVHPTGKGIVCVAVPGNAEEGVELQTKVGLADSVAVVPSADAVA